MDVGKYDIIYVCFDIEKTSSKVITNWIMYIVIIILAKQFAS